MRAQRLLPAARALPVAGLALVILLAKTAAAVSCGSASACEDCVANSSCAWLTMADASQYCTLSGSTLPRTLRHSLISNTSACPEESLTLLSGVDDGSLENIGASLTSSWVQEWTNVKKDQIICKASTCLSSSLTDAQREALWYYQSFDGDTIGWFGKNATTTDPCVEKLYQEKITIPTTATHLSFFCRATIDSLSKSRLEVLLDDNILMTVDYKNYAPLHPSLAALPFYKPVYVELGSEYADGSTHKLMLRVSNYKGSSPTVLVDYVKLAVYPKNGSWISDSQYTDTSGCAPGCQDTWTTDSQCDDACNNPQCTFDLGACESSGSYSSSTPCYDWHETKVKTVSQCFDSPTETCCTTDASITWVSNTLSNFNSSECNIPDTCMKYIKELTCAICDTETGMFYSGGYLQVCSSFATEMWTACKGAYRLSSGSCKLFSDVYNNDVVTFLSEGWKAEYSVSSKCFPYVASSSDDSGTSKIIIIAACAGGGALLIIVVTGAIVITIVVVKRKQPPEMYVTDRVIVAQDVNGDIVMVPSDNVMIPSDNMMIQQPVVLDSRGNILSNPASFPGNFPTMITPGIGQQMPAGIQVYQMMPQVGIPMEIAMGVEVSQGSLGGRSPRSPRSPRPPRSQGTGFTEPPPSTQEPPEL